MFRPARKLLQKNFVADFGVIFLRLYKGLALLKNHEFYQLKNSTCNQNTSQKIFCASLPITSIFEIASVLIVAIFFEASLRWTSLKICLWRIEKWTYLLKVRYGGEGRWELRFRGDKQAPIVSLIFGPYAAIGEDLNIFLMASFLTLYLCSHP